jgi:hypothetical protein
LAADSSSTEGIEGEPELQDRDVDDCNVDVDVDEFEVDAEVFNKIERFLEPESSLEGQVESDDAQESQMGRWSRKKTTSPSSGEQGGLGFNVYALGLWAFALGLGFRV